MSFVEAVRAAYRQYAVFQGRATRAEFWWFAALASLATLGMYATATALYLLSRDTGMLSIGASIVALFVLFSIVPAVSVSVRRLHDSGSSGWLILVLLVPYFGWAIFPVLMALPSSAAYNSHGPSRSRPSTDPRVQYWGRTRSGALLAFVEDFPKAIGAGYEPAWTEWIEFRRLQIFQVWYVRLGPNAPWLESDGQSSAPAFEIKPDAVVH
jgi:uncharacterized membrane protein YhaH (DUF805 family)